MLTRRSARSLARRPAMTDLNFSRAFERICDNSDSEVGDGVNLVLAELELALATETEDQAVERLRAAMVARQVGPAVEAVHDLLTDQVLNTETIFRGVRQERKVELVAMESLNTLAQLNTALRTSKLDRLAELYLARGTLLASQRRYREAITDFQQSLEWAVSKERSYSLHNRIAQAEAKLGRYSRAVNHLTLALVALKASTVVCKADKETFRRSLAASVTKLTGRLDRDAEAEAEPGPEMEEEHPQEAGLSALVQVESCEGRGRFAVAAADIPAGTVLTRAEPTVALLNPDDRRLVFEFCLVCLGPAPAPHPCLTCTSVVFCSPACRAAATFHRYQCQLDLYSLRQRDTEDAFNIFMVLQVREVYQVEQRE